MAFSNALKGKIYMWNRKYTTFLVTRVLVTCIVNVSDALDKNKSSGAAN